MAGRLKWQNNSVDCLLQLFDILNEVSLSLLVVPKVLAVNFLVFNLKELVVDVLGRAPLA